MPEIGESKASEHGARRWFEKVKADPLILKDIWIDATKDEQIVLTRSNPTGQACLPFKLKPDMKYKRGPNKAQKCIYPPLSEDVPSLDVLSLKGIHSTPRTIILDLDKLWLQV